MKVLKKPPKREVGYCREISMYEDDEDDGDDDSEPDEARDRGRTSCEGVWRCDMGGSDV